MNSLLIKNASAVITCDSKDTVMEHANILINNGVISYIGPEAQTADETLDASGYLVYPGLINTHHHLYQTFSRNLPQVQNMELFDWLTTLYEIRKNLDQDVIYHSSITGMGELLKTGVLLVLIFWTSEWTILPVVQEPRIMVPFKTSALHSLFC